MKYKLHHLYLFFVAIIFAYSASAITVIDPTTGWDGYFSWSDGLGPIDGIEGDTSGLWSITVEEDSIMGLAQAYDDFIVGDEFSLQINDELYFWDLETTNSGGYFLGEAYDIFLSAGTHTISLDVTAAAPGYLSGGAYASFSGVSAVVPEPSTVGLLALASIGGFILIRRKKHTS